MTEHHAPTHARTHTHTRRDTDTEDGMSGNGVSEVRVCGQTRNAVGRIHALHANTETETRSSRRQRRERRGFKKKIETSKQIKKRKRNDLRTWRRVAEGT